MSDCPPTPHDLRDDFKRQWYTQYLTRQPSWPTPDVNAAPVGAVAGTAVDAMPTPPGTCSTYFTSTQARAQGEGPCGCRPQAADTKAPGQAQEYPPSYQHHVQPHYPADRKSVV